MNKFGELGLNETTINALNSKGFEEPTEIQEKIIPRLINHNGDIIGQAQTGTGKTASFALPLIEKFDDSEKCVKVLILTPTRELAIQVCEEINSLKGDRKLSAVPVYGGQHISQQLNSLKKSPSFVVGTPGRVLDHLRRGSLNLSSVSYFILDEADEMLNMGFIEDVEAILEHAPEDKNILLFSATMPKRIKLLAEKYMRDDYLHIRTESKLTTALTDQIYFEVAHRDKFEALCRIIDIEEDFYALVFCRTRVEVDELARKLIDRGYNADGLHGDFSQEQRERMLGKFRKKQTSILAATDVAARGIDVSNLTHVINYSIPQNPEAYIHRIGRTGRAGQKGTAVTFVTPSEFRKLSFIKKITDTDIRRESVPGVSDIIKAKKKRITDSILEDISRGAEKKYIKWAGKITEDEESKKLIAAVLKNAFPDVMNGELYSEMSPAGKKGARNRRGISEVEKEGKTRLFIAKGRKDNLTKAGLVSFITKEAGTPSRLIDHVELNDAFSFITVPFAEAETIIRAFRKTSRGKRSLVEKAQKKKSKPKWNGKGKGRRKPKGRRK